MVQLYEILSLEPELGRAGQIRVVDGLGRELTTVQFAQRIGDAATLAELAAMPQQALQTRRLMVGVGATMIVTGLALPWLMPDDPGALGVGAAVGMGGVVLIPLTVVPEARAHARRRRIGAHYTDAEVVLGIQHHNATLRAGLAHAGGGEDPPG